MASDPHRERSGGEPPPFSSPSLGTEQIRDLAWADCGISRDHAGMEAALSTLQTSRWDLPEPLTLADIERRNMHEVVALIARMALWREESRGGHYRTDYPETRDEFAIPSQTSFARKPE